VNSQPLPLRHCHYCGKNIAPDVEHDTATEKSGVRFWCPEHCPQCNAAAEAEVQADDFKVRFGRGVRDAVIEVDGQPMRVEDLLRMQHGDFDKLRRLTSELFGDE
jgi:predicted nucleic acid-binding Zn ribbon protein